MDESHDLVTGAEAARILGVDPATVSRWSSENLRPDARQLEPVGRIGQYKVFARRDVERLRDARAAKRKAAS